MPHAPQYGNPLGVGAKITLAVLGVAVVGGALYFGLRAGGKAAAAQSSMQPQQPQQPQLPSPVSPTSPPPGAPIPTPIPPAIVGGAEGSMAPLPPSETVLDSWDTAVADVKLIHLSGEDRPYHVTVANKIDLPYRSGDYRFQSEEDAREFALNSAWAVGIPFAENDALISFKYVSPNGGAVWRSTEDDAFYITWSTPQESGQESGFADHTAALQGMYARLGLPPPPAQAQFVQKVS